MTDLTREGLVELAAKVEQASGPDAELDTAIWQAVHCRQPDEDPAYDPEYTASLDAAMALVPENLRLMLSEWDDEEHLRPRGPWQAVLTVPGAGSSFAEMDGAGRCEHAATPALALCAAALKARARAMEAGRG